MRRQPPVYSPITSGALWNAARALGAGNEPIQTVGAQLRADFRADTTVLFGSGTQALQVALEIAAKRVESPVVALPAFTCFDVASAAVGAGARIALYDIDPITLGPDVESLRSALKAGARVVVVAPLYGLPVDWEALEDVFRTYGAIGVEDAAQGHGASWREKPLGSLGTISVLSFGRGKGWTGGAGGALLLRGLEVPPRDELAAGNALPLLAKLGAQWLFGRPALFAVPSVIPWLHLGESIYRDPVPPRAITALACASLIALRVVAEDEASVRRRVGGSIMAALGSRKDLVITPLADSRPGFLRLPVRLNQGMAGFERPAEAARLGIAPSYPRPLGALAPVQSRLYAASSCPGAEELSRSLFTIPTHSLLTDTDRAELVRLLQRYGKSRA